VTRKILRVLVVVITYIFGGPAFSFAKPSPASSASVVPEARTAENRKILKALLVLSSPSESDTGKKINLLINNEPLSDVLQHIAEKTNISFRITADLHSTRIIANIHASNWEEGLNELLKDMNRLSVWDKNSRLTHVIILGGKNLTSNPTSSGASRQTSFTSVPQANKVRQTSIALPGDSAQNSEIPSESNLKKLLRIQPGNSLPENLFNNPEVNQFLKDNGIQSPNDWKEFHIARNVRKSVRRELRQILAEK
jgi:hypothetical protein